MNKQIISVTNRQKMLHEMFVGTLIYAVVLGFFDDYTDIIEVKSFSTIFLASIVLQLLTYLIFSLKKRLIARSKTKQSFTAKLPQLFLVWFVMFSSKFVFIGALNWLFGDYFYVSGFFGIMLVVVVTTLVYRIAQYGIRELVTS